MNEAGKRKIPDIAAEAESVIQSLIREDKRGYDRLDLKTNQIRKFLASVCYDDAPAMLFFHFFDPF